MKRKILLGLLGLSMLLQTTGCGTVMFSHRHGQSPGRIDPNVVILDGVGLLFFVIPGVVAYIVDFASGAIYLPEDVERGEGPFFQDDVEKKPAEDPVEGPAEDPAEDPE